MNKMNELQLLNRVTKDDLWLQNNLDKIRKKNEGKFVAVKDKKIIVADQKIEKVVAKLEKVGENPSFILIEFVHKKSFNIIL